MIKVCGVTTAADMALLAAAGVDLAGVWCEVPGGHADLSISAAAELMSTVAPRPALVTLAADLLRLGEMLDRTGARLVQLHGYQPPSIVGWLKRRGVAVLKVLHVLDGTCVEQRLIPSYERAGTDWFLLDRATADGRLGSTGQAIGAATALSIADQLSRPFLLAGGITAVNRAEYAGVVDHPGFVGIDVDTGARHAGALCGHRVAALVEAWSS
jgi:phosphoribosylanthranilate isomerase